VARSRRGLSHDYAVREARARAEGYRNDYDRRMHDHGRIPPGEPPLSTPAAKARARGHERERLEQNLKPNSLVLVSDSTRRADGRYTRLVVTVIDENGVEREFVLRGSAITRERLESLAAAVEASGAIISPAKSLTVATFAADIDDDADLDDAAYGVSN
jgi:hypothetical protein